MPIPAEALIAKPEDALSIRCHDHVHIASRPVAQDLSNAIPVRVRDE
jgi:hypothetical protein